MPINDYEYSINDPALVIPLPMFGNTDSTLTVIYSLVNPANTPFDPAIVKYDNLLGTLTI